MRIAQLERENYLLELECDLLKRRGKFTPKAQARATGVSARVGRSNPPSSIPAIVVQKEKASFVQPLKLTQHRLSLMLDAAIELLEEGLEKSGNDQAIADKLEEIEAGNIVDSSGHIPSAEWL